MKKLTFLNATLAGCVILVYLLSGYIGIIAEADEMTFVKVVRHVILVAGLIPACAWLVVILWSNNATLGKLMMLAVVITIYHGILFAVSAHKDDMSYWIAQSIEILAFIVMIRLTPKRGKAHSVGRQ